MLTDFPVMRSVRQRSVGRVDPTIKGSSGVSCGEDRIRGRAVGERGIGKNHAISLIHVFCIQIVYQEKIYILEQLE